LEGGRPKNTEESTTKSNHGKTIPKYWREAGPKILRNQQQSPTVISHNTLSYL
jgi:hypothetical protein